MAGILKGPGDGSYIFLKDMSCCTRERLYNYQNNGMEYKNKISTEEMEKVKAVQRKQWKRAWLPPWPWQPNREMWAPVGL